MESFIDEDGEITNEHFWHLMHRTHHVPPTPNYPSGTPAPPASPVFVGDAFIPFPDQAVINNHPPHLTIMQGVSRGQSRMKNLWVQHILDTYPNALVVKENGCTFIDTKTVRTYQPEPSRFFKFLQSIFN